MNGDSDCIRRVVAWTREASPPPGDPRRSRLSRVTALQSTEGIDEVSVRTWGTYVPVPSGNGTSAESQTSQRIEEFQEWARNGDHSLGPSFQRVERSTMVSEEPVPAIRPPVLCLAVYEDDSLVAVFPCEDQGETRTVEDCLDRLEGEELPDFSTADG